MSSDRNLMQFIFNHLLSPKLDRPAAVAGSFICVGIFLTVGLASDAVFGQDQFRRPQPRKFSGGFHPAQPHQFSDTPSPTEMMARLRFHKQQETPLFDLLREAGVDIFSKLSDDEKKLAGRFVEDMILKEGLDSERVSSLMDQMKIGDEAKRALKEGIARAGVDESASSPERRKELADKIRENFSQRLELQRSEPQPPSNQNWRQPEQQMPSNSLAARDREATQKRLEELGVEEFNPRSSTGGDQDSELARQQERNGLADRAATPNKRLPMNQTDTLDLESLRRQANRLPDEREQSRQLADSGAKESSGLRLPSTEPNRQDRPSQPSSPGDAFNNIPSARPPQSRPARQAFKQLESQLNESQRKIVSEFRNRVKRGDLSRQEIGKLLQDLKQPQSKGNFAGQLDRAGEKFGLPFETRKDIQDAFGELSAEERGSLEQAFDAVDEGLLEQLADARNERGGIRRGLADPDNTFSRLGREDPDLIASKIEDLRNEQLGKDFLKDAIETYNDAESGYELAPAFKQLKDRAEGIRSNREMANFGNLSKKLLDGSTNIFAPDSASNDSRPAGVKPGQRLDQLLAAAADKALAGDSSGGESESLFSGTLNKALEAALDKAVTIADKDAGKRNRSVAANRTPDNKLSFEDQFNSFENFNNSLPTNSFPDSSSNNSSSTASSNSDRSIDSAAASIADSVSQMKFNLWSMLYAAGLIALLAGVVVLLFRLIPSSDESVQKQRELQKKLQGDMSKPKDVVEAVDLFLLSRFGAASSWWNAKHAADEISTHQPDWRDRVASLFQVYRWSRYQADGNAEVSSEQNELVNSTLQELNRAPEDAFGTTLSYEAPVRLSSADDEATS